MRALRGNKHGVGTKEQRPVILQLGLPRVLDREYTVYKLPGTRVLVTFHFRLQISISGCSFLQSIDELLAFSEIWDSRFHLQFASLLFSNLTLG